MKTVKVPVTLIALVVIAIIALVVYLFTQSSKFTKGVVANEKMKLENERLSWLAQFNSKPIEEVEFREPIGFKLA